MPNQDHDKSALFIDPEIIFGCGSLASFSQIANWRRNRNDQVSPGKDRVTDLPASAKQHDNVELMSWFEFNKRIQDKIKNRGQKNEI